MLSGEAQPLAGEQGFAVPSTRTSGTIESYELAWPGSTCPGDLLRDLQTSVGGMTHNQIFWLTSSL